MHWFEMAARVPLLISAPGQFAAGRVTQAVSTADLLPTLVELAGGKLDPTCRWTAAHWCPHLQGQGGHDEVFGEYMAEGTISPLMMIRRGAYKFIYSEDDPCLLFDVHNDPQRAENLSQSAEHRPCSRRSCVKRGQMGHPGDPSTGARQPTPSPPGV
jgi:choline-sulfatase